MASSQRATQQPRICFIICVSAMLLLILFSQALRDRRQEDRHKRDILDSTDIPAEHIDPAAIDLTPLVNTLINTSQSGSRQLFSLLSVTSYSSLALHKLTLLVYNISSIRSVESNKYRRRFCYCVTNETNDLTDFTAILLDVMGNSTSYLHELFKSASILSVSQRNNSDCIYICVMAGKMGREVPELWEVGSIMPLFNQTIVEGPHREWHQLPMNLSHISPSGMSSMLTSRVHSTAHVSPTTMDETAATTTKITTAQPLATTRQPATIMPQSQTAANRPEGTTGGTTQKVTTQTVMRAQATATKSTTILQPTTTLHLTTGSVTTSVTPTTVRGLSITVGAQPTTVEAPLATVGAQPITIGAPSTTVGAQPTTLGAPSTTEGAQPTTVGAPSTTEGAQPTRVGAPPTKVRAPSTTIGDPSTPVGSPSTTVRAPSTTSTTIGAPSTTARAPSTTVRAPSTTIGAPSTTARAPSTTIGAPSTTARAPSTTIGAPSTTARAPSTTIGAPSTTARAPSTTVRAPSTTIGAPSTTIGDPSTTVGALTPTYGAPSTTVGAPLTTSTTQLATTSTKPTTFSPVISLTRLITTTHQPSISTQQTTYTAHSTRLSAVHPTAGPTVARRTSGPPSRRTTTPNMSVETEKAGCPWRRPELTDFSFSSITTTVGAHKLQPCVLELCKFFSQCLCRPFSHKTRMKRYCDDSHLWYEKHTSEVCRRVRRVSFSRNLKQRCLTKMCNKL